MKSRTTRAETSEARRQLIVETAAACFIEQGFHQTSIRDIAKRAGISVGNLYNHFDSKEALIAEIALLEAQQIDMLERSLSKVGDPQRALDRFVTLYLDYCCQPENTSLSAEIVAEALRNPEIGMGFQENRSRLTAGLADLIEILARSQSTKPRLSSSRCAEFTLDIIEGLAMRCALEGRKPGRGEVGAIKGIVKGFVSQ